MSVHDLAALVTALAVLLLGAVFIQVRRHAHATRDYAPVQGRAYRIRAFAFWAMVLIGLPVTVYLLRANPYAPPAAAAVQVVNATGSQWYWDLDREEVAAGQPVEFLVTSTDVNHGFGLYDEAGQLVAQTQAMPGYVNRLTHVFETPGTYRALCLEYCGLAHHNMRAELVVTGAAGGGNE